MNLTISARYEAAWPPGYMVWRGLVCLDGRQIHCSTHDSELEALRGATKARMAFMAGGFDEMVRQAMLLEREMEYAMFGEPAYSAKGEWDADETVVDMENGETKLSWS